MWLQNNIEKNMSGFKEYLNDSLGILHQLPYKRQAYLRIKFVILLLLIFFLPSY